MALVIFVRHGETQANREKNFGVSEDIPLTELGEQQAREMALKLKSRFRPAKLLSSKYARARRTSQIIAEHLDLDIEILDGIHERDFGYLKGLTYDHIPPVAFHDPHWTPEGGESRAELQARVLEALHGVLPQVAADEVLVVCHGAVIQSICAHLSGTWDNAHMPGNCGAVVARYEAGRLHGMEIFD